MYRIIINTMKKKKDIHKEAHTRKKGTHMNMNFMHVIRVYSCRQVGLYR